jgi:hypothetical protein
MESKHAGYLPYLDKIAGIMDVLPASLRRAVHVSNFQLSLMNLVLHVMMRKFENEFILGTLCLASSLHPIYRRPVSGRLVPG